MIDTSGLKCYTDEELKSLRHRALGISTRIIDEAVKDFFNKPMGTKIYIFDHYGTRQADDFLRRKVLIRLDYEHSTKAKMGQDEHGLYIVREEPTYHELVEEEIKRRKEND